jgi:hypothetical protein
MRKASENLPMPTG